MNPTPAVDAETMAGLRELCPDDPSFLRELIDIFLRDMPERIGEIEHALAKQDAVLLGRAAHTIKGSCSNFGATGLMKVSLEMEQQGKQAAFAEAAATLPALKAELALVAEALKQFR